MLARAAGGQNDVLDVCVQLYGGYRHMNESRVARAWRDARISKIGAGSHQNMKEPIGRYLGLSWPRRHISPRSADPSRCANTRSA